MNELQIFSYESNEVRTVMRNGEPWFCLVDVCRVLALAEPHRVANRLDKDERTQMTVTDSLGRKQKNWFINESGLYGVILRSDKPEAKAFKRWVTHDVLPSIRQTGTYAQPPVPVATPVVPELPADARLKRAELLIRAAEHPALPQDEQVRLLNQAVMDLTGVGVKSPTIGSEQFSKAGPRFPRSFACAGQEVE